MRELFLLTTAIMGHSRPRIAVMTEGKMRLRSLPNDGTGGRRRTMKIRMLEDVRPDVPFLAKPGTILRKSKEYEAKSNPNGAISGLCENGEWLGVRPDEFEFISAPKWVCSIWADVCPEALNGLN